LQNLLSAGVPAKTKEGVLRGDNRISFSGVFLADNGKKPAAVLSCHRSWKVCQSQMPTIILILPVQGCSR